MAKSKKGKQSPARGKLSGIDLSGVDDVPRDERGMQDFGAMLAATSSARAANDDPPEQSATEDAAKARKQRDKPKRTLRFSLDTVGGRNDKDEAASDRSPNRRSSSGASRPERVEHVSRGAVKVVRRLASLRGRRDAPPLSPSALSEASTAPPPSASKKKRDDDEEEVNSDDSDEEDNAQRHDPIDEKETEDDDGDVDRVAGADNEDSVEAAPINEQHDDDHNFPQPDDSGPMDNTSPPRRDPNPSDDDADEEEDDDDDEEEDLAPPPPPPQPENPLLLEPAARDDDDQLDFPAGGDDYNDDEDKEGKSYRMAEDDRDREDDSDDERRRSLKGAAAFSSSEDSQSKKASRSKKKKKTKRKISRGGSGSSTESDSGDSRRGRRKRSNKKKSKGAGSDTDDDSLAARSKTPATKKKAKKTSKSKFATTFSPKGVPLPRTYHTSPLPTQTNSPDSEERKGLRRSKRARIAPLAYWKGESVEYGPNDDFDSELYDGTARTMPVPIGIRKSEPTPYKKRVRAAATAAPKKKGKKKTKASSTESSPPEEDDSMKVFDTRRLRRKYSYFDGEETRVWNDTEAQIDVLKVISYPENLQLRRLPVRAYREPHEGDESGLAAQSFNVMHDRSDYPSYLMGTLILPPGGIKDPESVGRSAQTFTVVSCQPSSLEIAFADPEEDEGTFDPKTATRFFLFQDATFRIPPGNCYRLENHSRNVDAKLTWTIIRQNAPENLTEDVAGGNADDVDDEEEAGQDNDDEDPEDDERASPARGRASPARGRHRSGRGGKDEDDDEDSG